MKRLAKFAWFVAGFNLLTIVSGAVVRATESGAGCGRQWPLCQGTIESGADSVHRLTELTHRSLSASAAILVAVLALAVFRAFPKGTQPRRAAFWAGSTIIIESLLGAWLVLAELVEDNSSLMRSVAVPIHLVNTFLLLAALTLTAWLIQTGRMVVWAGPNRRWLVWGSVGLLGLGATGGVAALADTLFPVSSVVEGLTGDFADAAHFLTRLRIVHPVLAVAVGLWILLRAIKMRDIAPKPAQALAALVMFQLFLGLANVLLLTPLAIQIGHLLAADLIWMIWMLLGAQVLSQDTIGERA
jgi:heme A synthase